MNNYNLIMWSRNYEDTFEKQVERVYSSLLEMSKIEELVPRYLTGKSKKTAPEFELTRESVELLIEKNTDKKYAHLGTGTSIGFFTSKDDSKICSISITSGNKNPILTNSINVNISSMDLSNDIVKRNHIIELFKKLVEINNPFYACIVDYKNEQLYDSFYDNDKKIPKCIFWINYFGREVVERLSQINVSIDNIKNEIYHLEQQEEGYFIRLTETSIFDEVKKVALQKKINKEMGLG